MNRFIQQLTKISLNFAVLVGISFSSKAQLSNYASLPYYEGFESGVLDNNWYKTSSLAAGRVQIWPSDTLIWAGDTAMAVAGDKFLGMDVSTGGVLNLNQAWLGLNTVGASSLFLSFWWSDWNDETSVEDGIYISDNGGNTFTKVYDFLGGNNPDLNWVYFNFNLDSINLVHGLNYTANYVIKFQQYDDYYLGGGNDGFLFDEVNIAAVVTNASNLTANKFNVYPNPTDNQININNQKVTSFTSVNLINSLGQIILSKSFAPFVPIKFNLDVDPGIYFLEIINNNSKEVKQVVKK